MLLVWILLGIFALLGALLFPRIRFIIAANETLSLHIRFLGIKIPIYPKTKKKVCVRKFKKGYPKAQTKKEEKTKSPPEKGQKTTQEKIPFSEMVSAITELLKAFCGRFFKHLRLDVSKIIVTVGAENAASCAVTYGVAAQSVAYLLDFLDRNIQISKTRKGEIRVDCDYTQDHITYDILLSASLRGWQILDIGINLAYNYFKGKDIFHILHK